MVGIPDSKAGALAVLGLGPDADRDAVKAAFRARVKALHPDVCPATEHSVSGLAEVLAAMRVLESSDEFPAHVEISAAQAATGLVRVVTRIGGNLIVRIPPGVSDGDTVMAVGTATGVRISIAAPAPDCIDPAACPSGIPDFVERFASPSPAARFAGWARRRPSAA